MYVWQKEIIRKQIHYYPQIIMWSKLGEDSSVQMYKNSLIIRASMTEKLFIHVALQYVHKFIIMKTLLNF